MSPEKRLALVKLMAEPQIPSIEDGFNEELPYSGTHAAPHTLLKLSFICVVFFSAVYGSKRSRIRVISMDATISRWSGMPSQRTIVN